MRSHEPGHRPRALLCGVLVLPLLALLALALLGASAPAPPPAHRFEEPTQVVSVEVPVNAVDRDGHPVRGLTAADFEVFDEGARQRVTHFEVVDLDALRPDQAPGAAPQRPGEIGTMADVEAVDAAVRRHFMLLFDISYSSPTALLKARLAARDFVLHSLRPADLVAVATFSLATGPRLVLTFTPDRAQLAHAIDTLGLGKSEEAALPEGDPLRFVIAPPNQFADSGFDVASSPGAPGSGGGGPGGIRQEVRDAASSALLDTLVAARAAAEREQRAYERGQVFSYTRALGAMAKALAGLKGRKTIVYFSEGFDSRLLLGREDASTDEAVTELNNIALGHPELVDLDKRYGNTSLQSAVNRMLEEFRRADCIIQAIDIGGLRARGEAAGGSPVSGKEALFYIANETGGELFKDANNFRDQLERVLRRSTVTYLLAFQRSDLKSDGAYHQLRVKTRAPGVRLSYRTGYYAPRPFQELSPLEKSLLAAEGIASAAPRRDLDVNLLVAPFRETDRQAYVPVIIEVAGPSLLAGEQQSDRLGLEFYAYVNDRQGRMADFFTRRIALDVKKGREALQQTGVKYYGHLELAPGDYQVRVLVRDSESGRTGVQSAALSVPAYKDHQPVLLPPLFVEGHRRWVLVRERPKGDDGTVVYPFTIKGEPYVPAARPVLGGGDKARLCLVGYDLGKGDLTVEGKVLGPDGNPRPGGSLALLERTRTATSGREELVATFEPKGLAAGAYVLRVALTDRASGHTELSSLPFEVLR